MTSVLSWPLITRRLKRGSSLSQQRASEKSQTIPLDFSEKPTTFHSLLNSPRSRSWAGVEGDFGFLWKCRWFTAGIWDMLVSQVGYPQWLLLCTSSFALSFTCILAHSLIQSHSHPLSLRCKSSCKCPTATPLVTDGKGRMKTHQICNPFLTWAVAQRRDYPIRNTEQHTGGEIPVCACVCMCIKWFNSSAVCVCIAACAFWVTHPNPVTCRTKGLTGMYSEIHTSTYLLCCHQWSKRLPSISVQDWLI